MESESWQRSSRATSRQSRQKPPVTPSSSAPTVLENVDESRDETPTVLHPKRATKRGRYTSVACKECQRRKLKCSPVNGDDCARCIDKGIPCIYRRPILSPSRPANESSMSSFNFSSSAQLISLSSEVTTLRQELSVLVQTVHTLTDTIARPTPASRHSAPSSQPPLLQRPSSTNAQHVPLVHSPAGSEDADSRRQGHFIGPIRPAYAFHVGEGYLTRIGVPVHQSQPPSRSASPSRCPSPAYAPTPAEYWSRADESEIDRLIAVWREEVWVLYPYLDLGDAPALHRLLGRLRASASASEYDGSDLGPSGESDLDANLLQVIVASGLVLDRHGKSELAASIIASVCSRFFLEIYAQPVTLKRVQLLISISIYYFHAGEEMSSWRMIGLAARDALELGLHRKQSIWETFEDDATRTLATRVFWCLYVLDRRWSFGTGLSFAIVDRDVDPALPEPGPEHAYLKSMVGYGRLCSKIWEAIPPFEPSLHPIPDALVDKLDLEMQEWYHSIPFNLQLRHPRLGMAQASQPADLQRIRTMLYLRGNHARCLLYRHYLLSPATVSQNLKRAWLVVHIAEDSIEVLTHLRATTVLYAGQPHAFHYFLLSALAIMFLAVCHAPADFTKHCRKRFFEATELIKSFSQHSLACKRLWKTIRSLLCRLKAVGLQGNGEETIPADQPFKVSEKTPAAVAGDASRHLTSNPVGGIMFSPTTTVNNSAMDTYSTPHLSSGGSEIDQDFMSVFDALGQGYFHAPNDQGDLEMTRYPADFDFVTDLGGDILRQFQGFV